MTAAATTPRTKSHTAVAAATDVEKAKTVTTASARVLRATASVAGTGCAVPAMEALHASAPQPLKAAASASTRINSNAMAPMSRGAGSLRLDEVAVLLVAPVCWTTVISAMVTMLLRGSV